MPHARFPTTQWSLVSRLGDAHSLSSLCSLYREPLLTFAQRARGYATADAEDVVQEFFASLADGASFEPERGPDAGRFRSYLLGAFKHHLSRQKRHARAMKRGGGQTPERIDEHDDGPSDEAAGAQVELAYDRAWAIATLACAISRVEATYLEEGRGALFFTLKRLLQGERIGPDELGVTDGMLRVALHRFRRRVGREVRRVVATTVADPRDIEHEVQHLSNVLRHATWSLDLLQKR